MVIFIVTMAKNISEASQLLQKVMDMSWSLPNYIQLLHKNYKIQAGRKKKL